MKYDPTQNITMHKNSYTKYLIPNTKYSRGFTLIEVIIYVGIFAGVATILIGSLVTILNIEGRESSANEVTSQLNLVLQTVQRLVRESSLIEKTYEGSNEAAACATFCSVKLRMEAPAKDPTLIRSDATAVYLKEGTGTETPLTTDRIKVDNLKFTKYETPGSKATLQIDATFTYNIGNPQLAVTRRLQSAIGRATAATFDDHLLPNNDNSWDIGQTSPAKRWRSVVMSGNLTVGGAAAPGVSPTDTGRIYYDTASDKFKVSENGTAYVDLLGGATAWTEDSGNNKVYVTTPGRDVSIGSTANPTNKLEIVDSGAGTLGVVRLQNTVAAANNSAAQILFATNRTTSGLTNVAGIAGMITDIADTAYKGALMFYTADNAAPTERMRITSTGNVGIGTTNPGLGVGGGIDLSLVRSDVGGSTQIQIAGSRNVDGLNGAIHFLNNNPAGTFGSLAKISAHRAGANNTGDFVIETSTTGTLNERMRILANGNVGIGTASPGTRILHIAQANDDQNTVLAIENSQANAAASTAELADLEYRFGGVGAAIVRAGKESDFSSVANEDSFLSFFTRLNGSYEEKMRIKSGGNVGIGSTNPGSVVTVTGGDVYVSNSANGIILKSPDGTCARIQLGNLETLSQTSVACPTN